MNVPPRPQLPEHRPFEGQPTVTREDFVDLAKLVYGDRWQAPLARALNVRSQWVSRLLMDPPKSRLRAGHVEDLVRAAIDHAKELQLTLNRLLHRPWPSDRDDRDE